MSEKQVVVQQVDEIAIEVNEGWIVLEQKDTMGNEANRICFPISYASQIVNAIKSAAK